MSPWVADHLRRIGMGTAMYDLVDALGYKVISSEGKSDAGEEFWGGNTGLPWHKRMTTGMRWTGQEERNANLRRGDELEHG